MNIGKVLRELDVEPVEWPGTVPAPAETPAPPVEAPVEVPA